VKPAILSDSIEGESRDVALVHAGIARQCAMRGQPEKPPCVLISGGETTITLLANNDPLDFLQSYWRSAHDRPDAHQRQRLPRRADREGSGAARQHRES
jgi:hypothetical protein